MPGQPSRRLSRVVVPAALCLAFLLPVPQALAASALKVSEVFPGSAAAGQGAEYVELQMSAGGQADIDGQHVEFYDAGGDLHSSYSIPADVANGQSQRTVLLATQEAAAEGLVPAPDFDLGSGADDMDPAGGAICLTGAFPADCVTWGTIPLFSFLSSFPDPQGQNAAAIPDENALGRQIDRGCPTYLDAPDDSGSSLADFASVAPDPRNNAQIPAEARCAPDTALLSFPASPSSQTSAFFTYAEVPEEDGVSFECRLDSASFAPCPAAGQSYPGPIADGTHTFAVMAVGEGGQDPTPKTFTWTVDTDSPQTTLDAYPPEPSGGFEAAFAYHSSEPNSSFRCQLDSRAVQICPAAGKSYFLLEDGRHLFRVWAIDNAGNEDTTPAEHTFTVDGVLGDLTPPETSIISAPLDPSPATSAFFSFASNEQGSTFECSLNGAAFASCPSQGQSYRRLRNGTYRFEVRARDRAGNLDSVPAAYAWTVAAPLPKVRFTKAPPGRVTLRRGTGAKVTFSFRADKPSSSFRCRLDKNRFKPCSATARLRAPLGRHRFEVYAVDELGNAGESVARRIFRVERAKRGGKLF